MNSKYLVLSILFVTTRINFSHESNYWKDAPVEGTKIYSIYFTGPLNGYAVSANNDLFFLPMLSIPGIMMQKNRKPQHPGAVKCFGRQIFIVQL